MRLTPLALAIALTLAACGKSAVRDEAVATSDDRAPAVNAIDVSSVESTTVMLEPADAAPAKSRQQPAEEVDAIAVGGALANAQRRDAGVARERLEAKAADSESYAYAPSAPSPPPPMVMGYAQPTPVAAVPEQREAMPAALQAHLRAQRFQAQPGAVAALREPGEPALQRRVEAAAQLP